MKIKKGPLKGKTIEMAKATHEDLLYELADVLFDLEDCFVSDESHPNDFLKWDLDAKKHSDIYINGETREGLRQRFFDFYGIEMPIDEDDLYFGKLADLILGNKA